MKYHGWRNMETYYVNKWLSNHCAFAERLLELADSNRDDEYAFAVEIKRTVYDLMPLRNTEDNMFVNLYGMFSDLLHIALAKVAWSELAEHWLLDPALSWKSPSEAPTT